MLNPGKVPLESYMGTHDYSHMHYTSNHRVRMVVD